MLKIKRSNQRFVQLFDSLPSLPPDYAVHVTYKKPKAYSPPASLAAMLEDAFMRNDWTPTPRLIGTLHVSSLDFTH